VTATGAGAGAGTGAVVCVGAIVSSALVSNGWQLTND
jgi:hypothetical protein